MDITLAIFDFDGTLADTGRTIIVAKQEAMALMGLEVADDATCASTIGLSAKKGFELLYPELPEERIDECVTVYRRIFEEKKLTIPPVLFPGAEATLSALKEKGIALTIASSRNTASLREFLDKLGLAGYFPYYLGGDDTELLKPNPHPVLKTLEELSVRPENTMVVGDMPFDIAMGINAGTYTCGVTYGNASRQQLLDAGAHFVIDRIEQLTDIL